ncbi:MAG: AEC family transporter, partial [Proteobacteria bacterium]|nr:AEC family transporter [Pseudomonadota bacterium]
MSHVFSAIAPIFLIIGLGALLRAKFGLADAFWRGAEKLTFNVLFPSLLFIKIAGAHIDWADALSLAAAVIIGIHLTALAAVPLRKLLNLSEPAFVAVFQGGFRSNSYVGIAVVLGVYGDQAAGAMAVTIFTVGVSINYLGVWGHLRWLPRDGHPGTWRSILADSAKNPLIQSCLLGALFNITGWGLPPVIGPTLELLSHAALPLGLIAVGAGLSLGAITGASLPVCA